MDLQDQLKKLFPEHTPVESEKDAESRPEFWVPQTPILCKYEKRKGKPVTLLEGYTGTSEDFKKLTKALQSLLNVGGSYKKEVIIIQGDYRDKIMDFLKSKGFTVKRVGG
ncbi:MAG: translation initiation factor [Bacteroidota bacterium]